MTDREQEIERYRTLYAKESNYRMGLQRMAATVKLLDTVPRNQRTTYLDVGCGRGEMLWMAWALGFQQIHGIDPATGDFQLPPNGHFGSLSAEVTSFLAGTFSVTTCLDVMEHLLPEDVLPVCLELDRVTSGTVFITLSNEPVGRGPRFRRRYGELHINRRPYDEWDELFRSCFTGTVYRLGKCHRSETWGIVR